MQPTLHRRSFLYGLGATLGTAAFNAMLRAETPKPKTPGESPASPLAAKQGHHPASAKSCIMLFLEGGPSHIDTFDPKPKLDKLDMQEFQRSDKFASQMASGKRYYVKSPFTFSQRGKSGLWMVDDFQHLARVADDLCIYKGCVAESIDHPTACYHINTGTRFGGDPAIGSWVSYGLGTVNQNLPSFIVLPEVNFPQGGAANWSNGYLPVHHAATTLRPTGSPILDLAPPAHVTRNAQRRNLDLLAKLEAEHRARRPQHEDLSARLDSYELAYRMQSDVPELIDLGKEDQATRDMYGVGSKNADTDSVARRCLLARRLVERGVRLVQVYVSGWDSHDYIERSHGNRFKAIDQPVAALIADLKQRGLLDETLIVCCGEFGRTPDNGLRGGKKAGRDHNAKAMNILFAGGGTKAGQAIGATDELGDQAVECIHPIRDLHVTLLHLMGLNDNRLTYFHAGRFKQLSQFGGEVIKDVIA
ncbi:MAG: DUF1501 domain-containing protein [Phycisphaeraceae bacterium]